MTYCVVRIPTFYVQGKREDYLVGGAHPKSILRPLKATPY